MSSLAFLATLAAANRGGSSYHHVAQSVGLCEVLPGLEPWASFCTNSTTKEMCETYASFCAWNGSGSPNNAPATTVTAEGDAVDTLCVDNASWTVDQCEAKARELRDCVGDVWWPTVGRMEDVCAATCHNLGIRLCSGGNVPDITTTSSTTSTPRSTTSTPRSTTSTPRSTREERQTTSAPTTTTSQGGDLIPCVNDPSMSVDECLKQIATKPTCEGSVWWPVEGPIEVVCAETCHNSGARACQGGQVPTTTTTTTTTTATYGPTVAPDDAVLREVMATLSVADYSDILKAQQPDNTWLPSALYKADDMMVAVRKAVENGVGSLHLYDFNDVPGKTTEQRAQYALVNIAAFLAQAMQETIQYDACDENNWDFETYGDRRYRAASACGQLNQSYQDYKCGNDGTGINYECEVDPNMELVATTHAKWWGAPGPLFCGPKSKLPYAPVWNTGEAGCWGETSVYTDNFDEIVENIKGGKKCHDYKGQKAGYWSVEGTKGATNAPNSREDVEGCCWWGRGVIQTTGVCNFGKLNYHLGARAAREGRDALYPDVDFCTRPDKICSDPTHGDLKWFAGFFYYMSDVQPWNDAEFNYKQAVMDYVDRGYVNEAALIDNVSGIVNRGCPKANCGTGPLHARAERKKNFLTVLKGFGLKK